MRTHASVFSISEAASWRSARSASRAAIAVAIWSRSALVKKCYLGSSASRACGTPPLTDGTNRAGAVES